DVDLGGEELTVRRSKTRAGVRTLPLIPEAKRVLQEHRRYSVRNKAVRSLEGYVFPDAVGRRRTQQRTRTDWNALLAEAGVAHMCRNCGSEDRCSSSGGRFHPSRPR